MRRNFADILAGAGVDVATEYRSLHGLAYRRYGFYSLVASEFASVPFRGTAINIDDFNDRHGFDFEGCEESADLDYLLDFCEYLLNFAEAMAGAGRYTEDVAEMAEHLGKLADKLCYEVSERDGMIILVPRDEEVIAAAEVVPDAVGSGLVNYGYRGNEGDLEAKRAVLRGLAAELEPRRETLRDVARGFEGDLFFLLNSLNIRHNNVSPDGGRKYVRPVAEMSLGELEGWYDAVHRMCCAAFLLLDYADRVDQISGLKAGL